MRSMIIIVLFLLFHLGSLAQTLTINIPQNHFHVDENNSLIVSRIENMANYGSFSNYTEVIISLDETIFQLLGEADGLSYTEAFTVSEVATSNNYTLYFTELPLLSIQTETNIPDEPKIPGLLSYSAEDLSLTSFMGVELRGGSSLTYPKKNYDLEFWTDENGTSTVDAQLGGLRSDDDWILDALYNEPLRMRSSIASKLWLEMHSPSYSESEPQARSGVDVAYVELFVNGSYQGLYALSEQVDQKLLRLKEYDGLQRGELYKGYTWGATTFSSLPWYSNSSRSWGGYEMKYPHEDDLTDWANLYGFTDFVMNASNTDFTNELWNRFDKANLENYFIFLNLLRATDNTGKNIYLARYEEDAPYFYVPWDMDGCFGIIWNGTNENITDDILSNLLMNRASEMNESSYATELANRWFAHRSGLLDITTLQESFQNQFDVFTTRKIYEREAILYPDFDFSEAELNYLTTWLEERILFLDGYYNQLLTTTNENSGKNRITLYPNPAEDRVFILSNNPLNNQAYRILDVKGTLIESGQIQENYVSLANMKSGLYFFILSDQIYKLIVR